MTPQRSATENRAIPANRALDNWQIRDLVQSDLDDVCELCRVAFPLNYPTGWYEEVVTGRYISFGLFHNGTLTSLLVAERKKISECDIEDQTLCHMSEAIVIYILSLAVHEKYKRRGIATILLEHLLQMVCSVPPPPRLLFLHVLCDNHSAIAFYRKNGFHRHATLSNYYQIDGKYSDGCTFVRHISAGAHLFDLLAGGGARLGDLVASLSAMCGALLDFVASPFRKCFSHHQHQNGENGRQRDTVTATAAGDGDGERVLIVDSEKLVAGRM